VTKRGEDGDKRGQKEDKNSEEGVTKEERMDDKRDKRG
jgi:hypothetical protein